MARSAPLAPPPRVVAEQDREQQTAPANIESPSGEDPKYINFRVSREDFIDVKTAALKEGLTLGKYLMHAHRTYQSKKG